MSMHFIVKDINTLLEQLYGNGAGNCQDNEFYCPPSIDLERLKNIETLGSGMASAKCIPATWKCDKQMDCDGGEDEKGCELLYSVRLCCHIKVNVHLSAHYDPLYGF